MADAPKIALTKIEKASGDREGMFEATFDVEALRGTLSATVKVYDESEIDMVRFARHQFRLLLQQALDATTDWKKPERPSGQT